MHLLEGPTPSWVPEGSAKACVPEWALKGMACPHGFQSGLPFSTWTWPYEGVVTLHYVAAFYSAIPFFIMVGLPVLFLWTRGTREALAIVFWFQLVIVMLVLKTLVALPRPEGSCLTSCGMPSGHTMVSIAYLVWICLEVGLSRAVAVQRKVLLLSAACVLLLPVGWSRTFFKDHDWPQVIVGGLVALLMACVWYFFLNRPCASHFLDAAASSSAWTAIGGSGNYRPNSCSVDDLPGPGPAYGAAKAVSE